MCYRLVPDVCTCMFEIFAIKNLPISLIGHVIPHSKHIIKYLEALRNQDSDADDKRPF